MNTSQDNASNQIAKSEYPSDDHVKAIGRLVINVSELEILLTDMIIIFGQVSNYLAGMMMVHHQQVSSKIDTVLALVRRPMAKKSDDDYNNKLTELFARIREVADYRNTIVHGHWVIEEDGTHLAVRFTARGVFNRTRKPVLASEIHQAADEAGSLAETLRRLRDHMNESRE